MGIFNLVISESNFDYKTNKKELGKTYINKWLSNPKVCNLLYVCVSYLGLCNKLYQSIERLKQQRFITLQFLCNWKLGIVYLGPLYEISHEVTIKLLSRAVVSQGSARTG